jgi:hypothetical protein
MREADKRKTGKENIFVIVHDVLCGSDFLKIKPFLFYYYSPWAGQGRDQSSVRQPEWLWYAASYANS